MTACSISRRFGLARRASGSRAYFFSTNGRYTYVTSVLHLFDGNEMERSGINDVSSEGRRLRVGKDMAKAGITSFVAHLSPLHLICGVGHLDRRSYEMGFVNVGKPTLPSNLSTEAKRGSRVMTST